MRPSKTLSWLALGGVALTLSACGGGGQEPTTDANGNTVIKYWHAYSADSPELKTLEDEVIPAFEKAHPGIKVESVPYPYDELHKKLLTATAGGTLPCLVRSDIIWVPELAKLGTLAPLSDEMDGFDQIAAKTYDGPLATTEYDGKHYGLPLDTNTRVLMYNQATLDEAGMDKPPATFDDMRKLAEGLKGTGDFAFADNDTAGWNLLPWIWSAGGEMTDEGMTKATGYLNSPESVAGVQLLVDMYKMGEIPDLITGAQGGTETAVGLPKGDYATMLDGPWMFPIFEDQSPDFDAQDRTDAGRRRRLDLGRGRRGRRDDRQLPLQGRGDAVHRVPARRRRPEGHGRDRSDARALQPRLGADRHQALLRHLRQAARDRPAAAAAPRVPQDRGDPEDRGAEGLHR